MEEAPVKERLAGGPRIAVLGLHLEANAFAPPTRLEDFARQCLVRGAAMTALARGGTSHMPAEIAGFYHRMDATGPWQPVPVLIAAAPPGGPIEHAVFLDLLDAMRRGLAAALPLDGVYIASHGASASTGDEDSDGTLAAMVRQVVGPAVPILCSHDLHCNVSERLVAAVDALVVYRTNPHVDMAARAADCADLLREVLAGERLARAFVRLPLTPPSVTLLTASGPYAERIAEAEALMREDPRIANASVAAGFVFGDLPKCGMTVTVTARGGDAALAREAALCLARHAWAARHRHLPRLTPLAEAVAAAVAAGRGEAPPVLLADVADNPGGGGRGSTAYLLRALHEAEAQGVVLGVFVDPALAAEAHARGEGAVLEAVFNREESEFSRRFAAPARVLALRDGEGLGRRGTMAGRRFSLGPSALLELEGSGLRVVVGSLRRQLHEPAMLEMHGIDIAQARCVVVKSRGHFRAGFDEFFGEDRILEVDAPGLTSPVLANFAWKRLPRPVFPIDPEAAWEPQGSTIPATQAQ
ncbi:M81 family metallopeptidase [Paracraurococcus lichenis]|uniref:Microcystinase C n=1 Tax=Paracraurococcus lichenis TaxID=3064888 RepID=A0ABT9DZ15_9PROT|nr:M81 family metallopeptidase [Paracraurococcus sp. LOR1-02]MDO9709149.1 M81 family metallopeptidase [Paracraurococcus sp. LOR1-02]